mmetsp:Transcript_20857/g.32536  ORF Transcript_20857/g.32536 Transcript_20857/m.32536 type:complete len:142 (-) Transcript_20857:42-467(-)
MPRIPEKLSAQFAKISAPFTTPMSIPSQTKVEKFIHTLFISVAIFGFTIAFFLQSFSIAIYMLAAAYVVAIALVVPCWTSVWVSVDSAGEPRFVPDEEYDKYFKTAMRDPKNKSLEERVWYVRILRKIATFFKRRPKVKKE